GLRESLRKLLGQLKDEGKRLAAYGASAKGNTLLNYCGIGRETLEFVADRSTVKQGLYTPGTHLPICPPQKLLEEQPDYLLLLTWNFADEISASRQSTVDGEVASSPPSPNPGSPDARKAMRFRKTPLAGAFVIELDRREDERGFFARCWCKDEFLAHGIVAEWVQSNVSFNRWAGTLRGMHYQAE